MRSQKRGDARRAAILAFVRNQYTTSYAPSIREIATAVGASTATVHRHVQILSKLGLLVYKPGSSRTIRPVQPLRETDR